MAAIINKKKKEKIENKEKKKQKENVLFVERIK